MRLFLIMTVLICSLVRGCCHEDPRTEPPYPKPDEITGWKFSTDGGVRSLGNFLLKKNEATDNGKVRVKLLDVIPGDACAEGQSYLRLPSVKFQFIRVSDGKVLCEVSDAEHSTETIGAGPSSSCGNKLTEYDILGMLVNDINLKEGWVFFELRG